MEAYVPSNGTLRYRRYGSVRACGRRCYITQLGVLGDHWQAVPTERSLCVNNFRPLMQLEINLLKDFFLWQSKLEKNHDDLMQIDKLSTADLSSPLLIIFIPQVSLHLHSAMIHLAQKTRVNTRKGVHNAEHTRCLINIRTRAAVPVLVLYRGLCSHALI